MIFTLTAIVATLAAILIYAWRKPDTVHWERSRLIHATPEKIFPHLNDVHQQALWSPWDRKDPAMKKTFTGPSAGVGATVEWDGNRRVGAGRMEIVESVPDERIVTQLDFTRPMVAHHRAEYRLEREEGGTRVTWSMSGPQDLRAKLLSTLIDCESMCSREFDKGLSNLAHLVESPTI